MIQDYPTTNALKELRRYLSPRERAEMDALLTMRQPQAEAAQTAEPAQTPQAGSQIHQRIFRGNNAKAQEWLDPPRPAEFILSGASETGKTIAALTLLDKLARKFNNARLAIIRQYHVDLASTVLDVYKREFVEPAGDIKVFGGESPTFYEYPTGTRIWTFGMDRSARVLSGAFDGIYFNQAEETEIGDWETLTTRTTGRAGVIVPGLLFGDCNPLGSQHWILQRAQAGSLALLPTRHQDNPSLFDDAGNITGQGQTTIDRLSNLTGTRRKRLFEGLWVTPEGVIYNEFNRDVHVKKRAKPDFQYWLLAEDEGYTNPTVSLVVGVDSDMRLHVTEEFYQAGVLPSVHANTALAQARSFRANTAIVDPSATGLIAELRNAGLKVETPKTRSVERGIGVIHELLAIAKDGHSRLTIDPQCANIINEFESYQYKRGSMTILKENDHALDALRYLAVWLFADELETEEAHYPVVQVDSRW